MTLLSAQPRSTAGITRVLEAAHIFSWDPSDCQQAPNSGSGLITNDHDGTFHTGVLICIDGVVPGQVYDLGGMLRVPTGQTGIGFAYIGFYWYDAPGCAGTQTWAGGTPWVATSDDWVSVTMWGNVAPPGTQSAWVTLASNKSSAGTDAYLSYYDNVYFEVFGRIFADGFESGDTSLWLTTQY